MPDKVVYSSNTAKAILLFSFRNRILYIGLSSAWVRASALNVLDWDYFNLGKQSTKVTLKILDGTKPEKTKIFVPAKSICQLNLKTAERMKLPINKKLIDAAENFMSRQTS